MEGITPYPDLPNIVLHVLDQVARKQVGEQWLYAGSNSRLSWPSPRNWVSI